MADIGRTEYPNGVYPPSDDTFLLVDALSNDLCALDSQNSATEELAKRKQLKKVYPLRKVDVTFLLEIGSGSGFVVTSASLLLPNAFIVATDISNIACCATQGTLKAHEVWSHSDVVLSESLCCVRKQSEFDVILVNPPYVPTSSTELDSALETLRNDQNPSGNKNTSKIVDAAFALTWAGGEHGVEMLHKILTAALPCINSHGGRMYVVVVEENDPEAVAKFVQCLWDDIWQDKLRDCKNHGVERPKIRWSIALQRRAQNELLSIVRLIFGEKKST